jgi:hypothetical protein
MIVRSIRVVAMYDDDALTISRANMLSHDMEYGEMIILISGGG